MEEEEPRVSSQEASGSRVGSRTGTVARIRLENFMCHSSIQIELGDHVNFITGQNGSGKSAILTALCVAFGCRARGTQRASTLKDFIKTGCSYAAVHVELKNRGEDAFKPEAYGDMIIVERRITESSSSLVLKDWRGRKVAQRRDELRELVEHFNIDVENPCVIMSQDKSREFLHSGNDKDKFKFFYKATLLQQVNDLLQSIRSHLEATHAYIDQLESSIRPVMKELSELQEKIKNMEHVEEIALELQNLKKKLAWSWVYYVDKLIQEQETKLEKLKERIPACQARIDRYSGKVEELKGLLVDKKAHIASLMEKTSEVRRMKDELQQNLSLATKEKLDLEEEISRGRNSIEKLNRRVRSLEKQIDDIQQQHMKDTQAEESRHVERMKEIEDEVDVAQISVARLQEEENALHERFILESAVINDMSKEENVRKASICTENEVEALGGCGGTVEQLAAKIERLKQNLQHESQRYAETIDDLRDMYAKKERRILKEKQAYASFREKLNACQKALDLRWSKFQRSPSLLKRQLTWGFNGHLRKKGISGHIKVDYEEKVLSVEVKMPQDAPGNTVRDTRGLSGGERSFSTLCFALALHDMTEAPFRAMDEFVCSWMQLVRRSAWILWWILPLHRDHSGYS